MPRILVVDPLNRLVDALVPALRDHTHVVDVVYDLRGVVETTQRFQYSAVVLDVLRDDLSQSTLFSAIRTLRVPIPPSPKLLCVSASNAGASLRLQIEQSGARWASIEGLDYAEVLRELDVLLLESLRLNSAGPKILIHHRFHRPGTLCCPGEEIILVSLSNRSKEYELVLATEPMLVLDYMARSRLAHTATQIASAMSVDPFTARHAHFAGGPKRARKRRSPAAIKMDINRIRKGFAQCIETANLDVDPTAILVSEQVSNRVQYRLRVRPEWVHVP